MYTNGNYEIFVFSVTIFNEKFEFIVVIFITGGRFRDTYFSFRTRWPCHIFRITNNLKLLYFNLSIFSN